MVKVYHFFNDKAFESFNSHLMNIKELSSASIKIKAVEMLLCGLNHQNDAPVGFSG